MNDTQLLALVAETDRYGAGTPLPDDIRNVDAALVALVAQLNGTGPDTGFEGDSAERLMTGGPATTTEQAAPESASPTRAGRWRRGPVWAAAGFITVLAVGALIFLLGRWDPQNEVGEQPSTTTEAPSTTADASGWAPQDDVALAEAAFAAWYGNDPDTVARLLTIPGGTEAHSDWTIADVRGQVAYDSMVGSRADGLRCAEPEAEGLAFECEYTLTSTLTDAVGFAEEGRGERVPFRVLDGKLVLYEFADNDWVNDSFALYLGDIGEASGYEECTEAPLDEACAATQLAHLDGWTEWNRTATPADIAAGHIQAYLGGDCAALWAMGGPGFWGGSGFDRNTRGRPDRCPPGVDYERAMQGELQLSNCEVAPTIGYRFSCAGEYANALSRAVGAPPADVPVSLVLERSFGVAWSTSRIESAHPEDRDLARSVRIWARGAGLGDEVDAACGPSTPVKTAECAAFMLDNLGAWAAWYVANDQSS